MLDTTTMATSRSQNEEVELFEKERNYAIAEAVFEGPKSYAELREELDFTWDEFFTGLNILRDQNIMEAKNEDYEPYTYFGLTEYGEQLASEYRGVID